MTELNNNVNEQLTLRLRKFDGGDIVCILVGPRIQAAQPTYGFTAGFRGMTDISSVYCLQCYCEYCSTVIL